MTLRRSSRSQAPFAAYRLPHGRHGIPPEQVAENQRWRLLGAAAEVLAERGYAHTSSADIARRAAVSSSTFYKHFDDFSACLLAAYEMAADCVCYLVSGACERRRAQEWPTRLRAAIEEVLAFFASEPSLANLLGAAAPAGDAAIAAARDRFVNHLALSLRSARKLRGEAVPEMLPDTERRLIAAALFLLSDRVAAGQLDRLSDLAPQLAQLLLPHEVSHP